MVLCLRSIACKRVPSVQPLSCHLAPTLTEKNLPLLVIEPKTQDKRIDIYVPRPTTLFNVGHCQKLPKTVNFCKGRAQLLSADQIPVIHSNPVGELSFNNNSAPESPPKYEGVCSNFSSAGVSIKEPKVPSEDSSDSQDGKASGEQLYRVYNVLAQTLPTLFIKPLDYSIYNPNLIVENNIRGTKTVGLYHYVKQVALLRTVGHLKFAYVKLDVLKMTKHIEDSSIRVRWRINGISGLKVMLKFWSFKLWNYGEELRQHQSTWYDGFSIFYVGADGRVSKIIIDKVMPEDDEVTEKSSNTIQAKLSVLFGLPVSGSQVCELSFFFRRLLSTARRKISM